jgi:putative ubiquitin-RnfH superfamily antitoxin RatB of RatAB toxin-antitoxin module
MIRVEVVYALPQSYDAVTVELADGATVAQALIASGMAERHPGIDLSRVGVFGRSLSPEAPLSDGDRVEVYRPLALDPKEARRRRARRR